MQASKWGTFQTTSGQLVTAAVVGGTASELGGGKFANGAVNGAYTMLFNHMQKHGQEKKGEEQLKENILKIVNFEREHFIDVLNGNGTITANYSIDISIDGVTSSEIYKNVELMLQLPLVLA